MDRPLDDGTGWLRKSDRTEQQNDSDGGERTDHMAS
jgi:hypothetical protein